MKELNDQAFPGAIQGFWWRGKFRPFIAGADGTEDTDSKDSSGGTDTDDKSGGTDSDKSGEGDKDKDEKKFSQAELDSLISKSKSKALRGKLDPKELGFDSRKEMEDFIAAAKDKQTEDQTESERQLEEAKTKAREEAKQEVMKPAQRIALKAEFKLACADKNIPRDRADDAFSIAQNLEEWKDVDIDDQGVVKGLDDTFFDALKESKPWLFKEEGSEDKGSGDIGAGAGGGSRKSSETADETKMRETYPALRR